ncbi:MAG TPA: hypothetical protein VLI04_14875 [Nocardioidaceae bacterium]|nr:hypothetical protein [Nocardioidaceae bacterium]
MPRVTNTPNAVTEHVALRGHQTMKALIEAGFWDSTVFRALEMRLLTEVPRLGGYVASAPCATLGKWAR